MYNQTGQANGAYPYQQNGGYPQQATPPQPQSPPQPQQPQQYSLQQQQQYGMQPGMQQPYAMQPGQPGQQQYMQQQYGMQPGQQQYSAAQPGAPPQQYGMPQQQQFAQQQQQYGMPRGPAPQGGMPMNATMGLNHNAAVFTPTPRPASPTHAVPPAGPARGQSLTDEEQLWLDQQILQSANANQQPATDDPSLEDVELQAGATPGATAVPEGGYDDVMAMIEANRKKNEERRAAQSARNAEITAAFEARGA